MADGLGVRREPDQLEPPRSTEIQEPLAPGPLAWQGARRILLTFFLGWLMGMSLWIYQTWEASKAIAAVSDKVVEFKSRSREGVTSGELVNQILTDWDSRKDSDTLRYRRPLVQALLEAANKGGSSPLTAKAVFMELLRKNALPIALAQLFLMFFFPALFISMLFFAASEIDRMGSQPISSFSDLIWHGRHRRFLERQSQFFFFRRLTFAVLISIGLVGLFAPASPLASIVGEYVALHPMPGEPSYPFFLSFFKNAPPYAVGFAGFYLYALTTFLQRFQTNSLNECMLISLFNRGLVVVILSLVLSGITTGDNISRALIFAVGVFPQTGLQAIAKISQTTVDKLANDTSNGFQVLPEIDIWKEAALDESGISSIDDLAKADWRKVLESVGINPYVLLRSADRALLIHVFGFDAADGLKSIPVYTASELVLYTRGASAYEERWRQQGMTPRFRMVETLSLSESEGRKSLVEKALGIHDISLQIAQLECDPNVVFAIDNKIMYGAT